MRQEMKVGFAIGGVLLAVLVVYVLVVSSRDARKASDQVSLDTSGPTVSFPADHADGSAKSDSTKADSGKTTPPPADILTGNLMKPDKAPTGPSTVPADGGSAKTASNDPWASALNTGNVPTLMSTTPTVKAVTKGDGPTMVQMLDKVNFGIGNDEAFRKVGTDAATRPSGVDPNSRTHVIAAGETMSSIAAAAYGSSAYYPHILRANPSVDPKKLKVGTVLTMPPVDEVKPAELSSSSLTNTQRGFIADPAPRGPIDEKTQYVVQSGDSLYRISVKLYGKANHIDALAQANVGTVGADRRLKVGQILSLPEPPTVSR